MTSDSNVTAVSETRLSLFRMLLGGYLLFYIWMVWPDAAQLYSIKGIPRYERFIAGPGINWLRYAGRPEEVYAFFTVLAAAVFAFVLGIYRRIVAAIVFYGLFCMFTMGEYATCVANAYIGWTMLAFVLIPSGERWSLDRRRLKPPPGVWKFPPLIFWGGWAVFAVSYTSSGIDKWFYSGQWRDGSALPWILGTPLARDWWLPGITQYGLQGIAGNCATWFVIAGEFAAVPMSLFRLGRPLSWVIITLMHVGVLLLVRIPVVSAGMIVFHLFIFDERWLRRDFWRNTGLENVNISGR